MFLMTYFLHLFSRLPTASASSQLKSSFVQQWFLYTRLCYTEPIENRYSYKCKGNQRVITTGKNAELWHRRTQTRQSPGHIKRFLSFQRTNFPSWALEESHSQRAASPRTWCKNGNCASMWEREPLNFLHHNLVSLEKVTLVRTARKWEEPLRNIPRGRRRQVRISSPNGCREEEN